MQEDLRFLKTKNKLYHALGELMKESSFDKITVSDIVRESGITRKTFYNHYQDKIDLVQEYQKELSENIQHNFIQGNDFSHISIFQLARYLDEQDYLLTALLSYNGSLEVQNIFRDTMEKYCKRLLRLTITDPLQLEYQAVLSAGAIFSTIQHWLVTGKRIAPEELANIVLKLRFHSE